MIVVLSPSKKLALQPIEGSETTQPELLEYSERLIAVLRQLSKEKVSALMGLSHALTELNYQRYQAFEFPFTLDNAAPALTSFKGDVYDGLQGETFSKEQRAFAQKHVRILSGLYGVLRPLDLIQPYRLEMGTKLATPDAKNLYEFWGERITKIIERESRGSGGNPCLINLASNEYFKVVRPKSLSIPVITIHFKERKDGQYRSLMLYVKRARGMMARYIVERQITNPEEIRHFNEDGYTYNEDLSDETNWTFTR